MKPDKTKEKIKELVKKYIDSLDNNLFVAGQTYIRSSGVDWNSNDVDSLMNVVLSKNYADGAVAYEFERLLANFIKQRHVILCNSGSSANLLALTALMSKEFGDKAIKRGDEIIVVAAGFPTTVNPVVQNGLIPVFVDISLPTDRKSTRLNSSHSAKSRMPSSA